MSNLVLTPVTFWRAITNFGSLGTQDLIDTSFANHLIVTDIRFYVSFDSSPENTCGASIGNNSTAYDNVCAIQTINSGGLTNGSLAQLSLAASKRLNISTSGSPLKLKVTTAQGTLQGFFFIRGFIIPSSTTGNSVP